MHERKLLSTPSVQQTYSAGASHMADSLAGPCPFISLCLHDYMVS